MSIFFEKISIVLVSLWVGGLWTMLMVTTVLFNKMPNYIASSLALDMHLFVNLFGVISSLILLFLGFKSTGAAYLKSSIFWMIIILLVIIFISYFGINPLIENLKVNDLPKELMEGFFAERFDNWYGIASIAYLIECIIGIFLLLKVR
jgi:hypothetical protein|tara:strand:+ start:764 stop:1207 length:444 start_codon:yes stop_codon:yes gene_type:complete